jgi:fibronectin type 3 domain-containing protein
MKPASIALLLVLATLPALAAPGAFTISGSAICSDPATHRPGIRLTWPASTGATGYEVYRQGNLIGTIPAGGAWTFENSDNSMSPGQTISYYVVAKDNSGGSFTSNTVDVFIPFDVCQPAPAPPVLDGNAACDTSGPRAVVLLTWSGSPTAASYRITRTPTTTGFPVDTTASSYNDTNVSPGQSYDYKVTATNSGGSTDSNTKTITISNTICPPATPTATATATCVTASDPAVHVAWSFTPFATSYVVKRGGTPISGTLAGDATSFDDTNVTIGQTYSYTVTASNTNGSATSAPVQATVQNLPCVPNPPGPFSARANAGCDNNAPVAHVSWDPSPGASSYVVNRNGTPVSSTLSSSTDHFNDTTVTSGQSYTFTVTASNVSGNTTSSPADVTVPACGTPPSSFTASVSAFCNAGSPAVHVTWTSSTGVASYIVSRNGIDISGVLSAGTSSFDDANVTAGQSYSYAVRASNSTGSTTAQAGSLTPAASICPPPAFTLTASATCNPIVSPPAAMVTLNWSAAATATNYLILSNGAQIGSVGGGTTTFNDSGASAAGTYTYVVRAVGPGGNTDSNSASATVTQNMCGTPKPDLAAIDVVIALPAGQPGDAMSGAITVANQGSVSAPATTSRVRIGSGATLSPSDPVVATIATPSLGVSASTTQTFNFTVPSLPAGTYFFFLTVDDDHVSGDINPANDVKRSAGFAVQGPSCTLGCGAIVPSTEQASTPIAFTVQTPSCSNVSAAWNFGDNTTSTGFTPTHAYAAPGTYHWTVTLTASTGQTCSNGGIITITAPTAPPKRRAVRH